MKNPLQALLWSANATSSTAFSTGNEPNAVSEREQSELRLPHPLRLSAFFTTFPGLYLWKKPYRKQKTLVLIKSYCFRFLDTLGSLWRPHRRWRINLFSSTPYDVMDGDRFWLNSVSGLVYNLLSSPRISRILVESPRSPTSESLWRRRLRQEWALQKVVQHPGRSLCKYHPF